MPAKQGAGLQHFKFNELLDLDSIVTYVTQIKNVTLGGFVLKTLDFIAVRN